MLMLGVVHSLELILCNGLMRYRMLEINIYTTVN